MCVTGASIADVFYGACWSLTIVTAIALVTHHTGQLDAEAVEDEELSPCPYTGEPIPGHSWLSVMPNNVYKQLTMSTNNHEMHGTYSSDSSHVPRHHECDSHVHCDRGAYGLVRLVRFVANDHVGFYGVHDTILHATPSPTSTRKSMTRQTTIRT